MKSSSNTPPWLRNSRPLSSSPSAWRREPQTVGILFNLLAADRRDPCRLPSRIEFVFDAVEAGHQHRGEKRDTDWRADRGIAPRRAWPSGWWCREYGTKPNGCALNRRATRALETRHQTLVRIGGRIGEGVDCLGMLDDAGDVRRQISDRSEYLLPANTGLPAFQID